MKGQKQLSKKQKSVREKLQRVEKGLLAAKNKVIPKTAMNKKVWMLRS